MSLCALGVWGYAAAMVGRVSLGLLGLIAAGCTPDEGPRWVGYPPLDGAQSVVFAIHGERTVAFHAVDVARGGALRFDASPTEDAPALIEAFVYDVALSVLELQPGLLEAVPAGERSRPLPQSASNWRIEVGALDDEAAWATAKRSAEADAFRIPAIQLRGCAMLDSRVVELPTQSLTSFAETDTNGDVLVGTFRAEIFRVDTSSITPLTGVPGDVLSAYRDPQGTWWFGGRFGRLWTGSVTDALHVSRVPSMPGADIMQWIDGGIGPDGVEIVALTGEGRVGRYVAGAWTMLHQFDEPIEPALIGGIAWTGPGAAVVAWPFIRDALVITGDDAVLEPAAAAPHSLTAVGYVPGRGPILGTSEGLVLDRFHGSWKLADGVQPGDFEVQLLDVLPFPNGYMISGEFGTVRQWASPGVLCPMQASLLPDAALHIARLGDDHFILVGGNPAQQTQTPMSIVRFEIP